MRRYKISNILLQANHLLRQHGYPVRNSRIPRQPRNVLWKIWTLTLPGKHEKTSD